MKKINSRRLISVFMSFALMISVLSGAGVLQAFAQMADPATADTTAQPAAIVAGPGADSKAYISSHTANTAGDNKTLDLTIVDERVKFEDIANYGNATVTNIAGNFSAAVDSVSAPESIAVSTAAGTYNAIKYTVKLKDVKTTGEGNTLTFDIAYLSSTVSIMPYPVTMTINEDFTAPKTAEPLGTATAYVSNYQVVDAAGNPLASVKPGDKVIVAVTIIDERITNDSFGNISAGSQTGRIHVTMTQGSFTIGSTNNVTAKLRNAVPVKGTSGTYNALCYTIEFRDVTYLGGAPTFGFGISYTDHVAGSPTQDNNVPLPYPYTSLSLNMTQATDDVPAPTIILNSANYGKVAIIGEKFILSTVATNTSDNLDLENVSIKIDLPAGLTLSIGNSQVLIGKVGKKGTIKHDYALIAEGVANDVKTLPVKVTYTYEAFVAGKRTAFTSVQDLSINVQQPTRFAISSTDFSQQVYANQGGYLTAQLVNKGKTTVFNVTAEIKSDKLTGAQVQFVGNVAPGTTQEASFDFTASEVGNFKGQVVITYEDASGTQSTLTSDFSVEVLEEMVMKPGIDEPVIAPEQKTNFVPYIIGAVIIIAIAVFVFLKKRKKKKLQELEDEDENI